MAKYKTWDGLGLHGTASIKLDGINVRIRDGVPYSRAGNRLEFVSLSPDGEYELFHVDWSTSISIARGTLGFCDSFLYSLDPIDKRIFLQKGHMSAEDINALFGTVRLAGHEGLVLLDSEGVRHKVKDKETYDVTVTGLKEGKGRNTGKLGAFITEMGNVGTGLTNAQRVEFFNQELVGTIIEVEAECLTPGGKFKCPRFKRLRLDKGEVNEFS